MLFDALKLIQEELDQFLRQRLPSTAEMATLGNIALQEQDDNNLPDDRVVISLVNLEEERALKNIRTTGRTDINGQAVYEHPPTHLNIYVLFSANASIYENALRHLSLVFEFFQTRPVFTIQAFPNSSIANNLDDQDRSRLRLSFNLYSMTFEQQNHVWGALGGKMLPAAMYRVTLVEVKDRQSRGTGPVIEEVLGQETIL